MVTKSDVTPLESSRLVLSILDTMLLWRDERYIPYLVENDVPPFEDKWFQRFLSEWFIARNIRAGRRSDVRNYLNRYFPRMLEVDADGSAVDRAAASIQSKRLSAKVGKNKIHANPVSLVSKVAFLLDPEAYVPMDKWSKSGLARVRVEQSIGGLRSSTFESYRDYLENFNRFFATHSRQIWEEINQEWAVSLASQLGLTGKQRRSKAFRRKVYDRVLMEVGRA